VTKALGYTFDAVFRKTGAPAGTQPWNVQVNLALDMVDEPDLRDWMSRKTMKPMAGRFAGAVEFVHVDTELESFSQDPWFQKEVCAA